MKSSLNFSIKIKFQDFDKIHDLELIDDNDLTFFQQQEKFLSSIGFEKDKKMYSLFNPQINRFFINTNEIKISNYREQVYVLKNCIDLANKIVKDMYKYINSYKEKTKRISLLMIIPNSIANELKNVVFSLQNYFQIDGFTEEFIALDGIEKLIEGQIPMKKYSMIYASTTIVRPKKKLVINFLILEYFFYLGGYIREGKISMATF